MNFSKSIWISLILLILCCQKSLGQDIINKVIYVAPSPVVTLKFGSTIKQYEIQGESKNLFNLRRLSEKIISITSTGPNFRPANLIVIEGTNNHVFSIQYKATLESLEQSYDFSTKRILRRIADTLKTVAKQDADSLLKAQVAYTKDSTQKAKDSIARMANMAAVLTGPTPKQIDSLYGVTIIKANQARIDNKNELAEELYTTASKLKPDETFPKRRLEDLAKLKETAKKGDQQKAIDAAYKKYMSSGDSAFNGKSLDVAAAAYNQALIEKPNDARANAGLQKIESARKSELYQSYMNLGRGEGSKGSFDEAESAFKEALKIKPKDPDATKELNKLAGNKASFQKKKTTDNSVAEKESRYNDTLAAANNLFESSSLTEARKKYDKARLMKPGDAFVVQRIASIDSSMSAKKSLVTKLKQDSLNTIDYNNLLEKAKDATTRKDFKKAKEWYAQAQKLKPGEVYPAQKISEIEVLMLGVDKDKIAAMADKRKNDSISRLYDSYIKQATAARNKEDYPNAKVYFTKAHDLKTDENVPTEQLKLVNAKLEEIRLNNNYNLFKHDGINAYSNLKDYKTALRWFDSAHAIKPDDYYATNMIQTISKIIAKDDSTKRDTELKNNLTSRYNEVVDRYNKAELERLQKNYQPAYKLYAEFLSKIDTANYDKYNSTQRQAIKQSREMLTSRLLQYKPDPVADSLKNAHIQDSLNNIKSGKGRKKKKS